MRSDSDYQPPQIRTLAAREVVERMGPVSCGSTLFSESGGRVGTCSSVSLGD